MLLLLVPASICTTSERSRQREQGHEQEPERERKRLAGAPWSPSSFKWGLRYGVESGLRDFRHHDGLQMLTLQSILREVG